jgi:alkyl sulfatase BDS1-like metallo-beta-lactamase superfamily hydrolase
VTRTGLQDARVGVDRTRAEIAGDEKVLESLLDVLERDNPSFNIMTP